jgi:hypothetical protein
MTTRQAERRGCSPPRTPQAAELQVLAELRILQLDLNLTPPDDVPDTGLDLDRGAVRRGPGMTRPGPA